MNISVDAIINVVDGTVSEGLYPRRLSVNDFSIRFYKLLKNNMPTCDGKPKWPVKLLTAAWVCTERWTTRPRLQPGAVFGSVGGGCRDRTDDPLLAKQVLSQLS